MDPAFAIGSSATAFHGAEAVRSTAQVGWAALLGRAIFNNY